MTGKYFVFDGENSIEYNLMIAGIERNEEINLALEREVLRGTLNRYRSKVFHMGASWKEPLSFQITFMKDACKHQYSDAAMIFNEQEVNEIAAWLTSPDYPTLFHMYDFFQEVNPTNNMILVDFNEGTEHIYKIYSSGYKPQTYTVHYDWTFQVDVDYSAEGLVPPILEIQLGPKCVAFGTDNEDYIAGISSIIVDGDRATEDTIRDDYEEYDVEKSYYVILNHKYDYFGVFENLEPQVIDGNVVGFIATFTTNSPFAWTPLITRTTNENTLNFYVNNAEKYREIYPIISITPTSNDDGELDPNIDYHICTEQEYDHETYIPTIEGTSGVIYLVPKPVPRIGSATIGDSAVSGNNIYYEFIYNGQSFEMDETYISILNTQDGRILTLNIPKNLTTVIDCEKCLIYHTTDINDKDQQIYVNIDDVLALDNEWVSNVLIKNGVMTINLDAKRPIDSTITETGISDAKQIFWPKLYNGFNKFQITGKCEFTISYREPRKVGEY